MRKELSNEIKVGIFVSAGTILLMLAIIILGGGKDFFSRKSTYRAYFSNVEGLLTGAKVILGGVSVGTVDSIAFNSEKKNIQVDLSVTKNSSDWIRKDSTVEIATQGVLGDKYIIINGGSDDQPLLPADSIIETRPTRDISHFLNKGDHLIATLSSLTESVDRILKSFEHDRRNDIFFKNLAQTTKNMANLTSKMDDQMENIQLKKTVHHLSQIFEKVNNGTGTLGALINDPSLYDEVRALMGGANRNRLIRNLVRKTIQDSEQNKSPVKN